jgi:periplasmic protein TonB
MKKVIASTVIILMLLFTSCTHIIEVSEDPNYIPPVIKVQPRLIYPQAAQENAYSGTIKVYLQISSEGDVEKTTLIKSSGYELLDVDAVNYCRRLKFSPGLRDGKPVISRILWVIKYNLSDQNETSDNILAEINELYKQIPSVTDTNRNLVERKILQKYNQLIDETSDGIYFNKAITQIISEELTAEWQHYWDSFPLTFLLYQDFIERFKDYNDITIVKTLLKNSLLTDVQYINDTQTSDIHSKTNKDLLLHKIRNFTKAHYPEIKIEE